MIAIVQVGSSTLDVNCWRISRSGDFSRGLVSLAMTGIVGCVKEIFPRKSWSD